MLEKQYTIQSHIATERAIDEYRRQMGIIIGEDKGLQNGAYPVEFLSETLLTALRSQDAQLKLVITGARARSLKLTAQKGDAWQIDASALSLAQIQSLADPVAAKTKTPDVTITPADKTQQLALKLAKYASLLPALIIITGKKLNESPYLHYALTADDIRSYIATPLVDIIETAKAALPVEGIENSSIFSFRSRYSTAVHLALVMGDITSAKTPLTRIHSSCVTGDILGSLRCDCGDQLRLAMKQISDNGSGILIYLHQEGRGIGITNKLRAYQLQEQGHDTYEANLMLGFDEDERDFAIAAAILKKLGVTQIDMLTNNPHKIEAIEKNGIKVAKRVPLIAESGKHNHGYLETKAKKSGHLF